MKMKRCLGILMAICMLLSLLPASTFAAEDEQYIEFTTSSMRLPGNTYYTAYTTVEDIDVQISSLGNFGKGIQMKNDTLYGVMSSLRNGTALPGGITKIEFTYRADQPVCDDGDMVVYFGYMSYGDTCTITFRTEADTTVYTVIPDSDDYRFFHFQWEGEEVSYWDSIKVYYTEVPQLEDDLEKAELVNGFYEIYTAGQLYWFADQVNSGNNAINGKLMADIVVNENVLNADGTLSTHNFAQWTPIGYSNSWKDESPFAGTFDGNGKTVSGLYFNDTTKSNVGLFGYVNASGTVKNVGVLDSYLKGANTVAGVVGSGSGVTENCYSTATIEGANYVAGVVGSAGGTARGCYNSGIIIGQEYVGGVAGSGNATVSRCYNTGSVQGIKYVAGVMGCCKGTVENCYNTGTVHGRTYVGGIVGQNHQMVCNSYNIGNITTEGWYNEQYAAVVGYNWNGSVDNCFYLYDCCDSYDYYAQDVSERELFGGWVAQWLQGDQAEQIWGQEIGVDELPVLGGPKVYQLPSCGGEDWGYANSEDAVLDHLYYEEVFSNSCEQDGYTRYTCAWCGDIYHDNETEATGHAFTNGICSNCGDYEQPVSVDDRHYEIYNLGQLYWFAQRVNYGYEYISGKLMADIVINENVLNADGTLNGDGSNFREWTPIEGFYGTFDGNGKTISGLYINDDGQFVGLFETLEAGGVVKNLGLEDAYVLGGSYVGGIVGSNDGAIINCYFNGTVVVDYFAGGGIAGCNTGTITGCYAAGSVTSGHYNGALTGQPGGVVYHSYYLEGTCDTSEQGISKTAQQFASGEVALLLQGYQSADAWGQEIGVDALPKLGGMKVYQDCAADVYSNDSTQSGAHSFRDGFCDRCGAFEPALLNGDVYEISNAGQLYWFAAEVNAGDTMINGKLMGNIVVNENVLSADGTLNGDGSNFRAWEPIGSCALEYSGTFDGCEWTISGLYSGDDCYSAGLFGAVGLDGIVERVGLVDQYMNGIVYSGGVIGYNSGKVENCYNAGCVIGQTCYVGGVAGFNDGEISFSYNTGSVTGSNRVGGVIGENNYGNVHDIYNTGSVSGEEYVGGVIGYNSNGAVWNTYNTGAVTGNQYVGGLIGCNLGNLSTSYNTGSVTASGDCVGGVVGENYNMLYACYNLGSVSGSSYVGGVVGSNGTYNNPNVYYCYNIGTVTGTGSYVGGVEGFHGYSSTLYSYYLAGCATDGNGTVHNGIGAEALGSVTEDYESCVEGKTAEQFASGEVCYLLQQVTYEGPWGQRIGTDDSPVFSDCIVYESDGLYTNTRPYGNLSGTITSFMDNSNVTIELIRNGEVCYTARVRGKEAEYHIKEVKSGKYTLRLSKANHGTVEYSVVVENLDITMDLMLSPYGDVTGDGNVNIKDFQRLLRHVNKINPLSGYALACGDVTGDGQVNIKDFQRLLRHVNKTNPLYPDKKDVTIKVWVPSEDLMEGYSWLEEMQRRFEAKHPEYCIFWINEAMGQGDAFSAITMDPNEAADVYMYVHDQQLRLIEAGGLAQLTDTYADQVKADNTQLAVDSVTHTDGEIYGLPMESNTWFLYYNKQVFTEEDVKNLDVMLEKGRVSLPFNNAWNAGAFFLGCGGTLFGEHGRDAEAGIDFSGANGGYMAVKKMVELAQHPNSIFGGLDEYRLITGEVDAIFSGAWVFESLKQALGDNLGIAMLPKFTIDGEEYQMTAMSGTKCVGVNDNVDNSDGKLDLCMEFAAFLASEEGQLLRYEMRGVTPIHVNMDENESVTANDLAMAEINTMRDASVLHPYLNEMNYFWTPMDAFARGIINGEINLDNYEEMVDRLNECFNNTSL